MRKKLRMYRKPKKSLALTFLLVLVILVPLISGRGSASEVGESPGIVAEHTEAVVAQGEHVVAESHEVEHVEEPWWKFTGWEAVFAVLATVFFLLLTRWLPVILEDKSGGSSL